MVVTFIDKLAVGLQLKGGLDIFIVKFDTTVLKKKLNNTSIVLRFMYIRAKSDIDPNGFIENAIKCLH